MTIVTNLGFPRIGARRELKRALESYWRGDSSAQSLLHTAQALRHRHWDLQRQAGVDLPPSNDFSLYDHVLDTAYLFDAIPTRYQSIIAQDPLRGYFAMARGYQQGSTDVKALEMTKWFDTNYHYLVPELQRNQQFQLRGDKPIAEFCEAKSLGIITRPVILGPISFLLLAKTIDGSERLDLLDALLPAYGQLLDRLHQAGAAWVQIDEPFLVLDLDQRTQQAYLHAYTKLAKITRPQLLLTTYFGHLDRNLELVSRLPVEGLHIDLTQGDRHVQDIIATIPRRWVLSAGLINGRNVWRHSLPALLALAQRMKQQRPESTLWLAPSCSLLHVPIDVDLEKQMDDDLRGWLAFARQKLMELRTLADALQDPGSLANVAVTKSQEIWQARLSSPKVHDPNVSERLRTLSDQHRQRQTIHLQRRQSQQRALPLPLFPTTTIGSFPQTLDIRQARAKYRAQKLDPSDYVQFLREHVAQCIRTQEQIGLDVLVHGEFERNDMVEYFGEQLNGFAFTKLGWVQSYGSRCVKPPIIYGDVSRPAPMTIEWAKYAQSLTQRPVKGMLTGPVTMLQWSFVRDDQARTLTCQQIALALRDEVCDLEGAGIRIIQIDEPALREGLPLRREDWEQYLRWAVDCFRLSASGVADTTQIHTHMCYSEFNDIIQAIARLDADVISIETSRSRMELLQAFVQFAYPNQIGPGVYDIHSPRIPSVTEIIDLLSQAQAVLPPEQIWVNPDCGLKTRAWPETHAALCAMVAAAKELRQAQSQAIAAHSLNEPA